MFDDWNSAKIWWVVFGRRRFGGSMLVYLTVDIHWNLVFVWLLDQPMAMLHDTGTFFGVPYMWPCWKSLPNSSKIWPPWGITDIICSLGGWVAIAFSVGFGNVEISHAVVMFQTSELWQSQQFCYSTSWLMLQLVLSFLLGHVAVHSCSKFKPTTAELHETTFFLSQKDGFCFRMAGMTGIECSKGTSDISSSPGFPGFDVLFCCCLVVFFQRMEFVVENPQVGWKKMVWKIVVRNL